MKHIVLIDAQKQTRDRVESLLAAYKDIKILAQGQDGYDALRLTGSIKPDIVILDNQLEFIDDEDIVPLLMLRSPSTALIILAAKINDFQLCSAAQNKVSGLVDKEKDLDILPMVIEYVSSGGYFISPAIAARVLVFFSRIKCNNTKSSANSVKMLLNGIPGKHLTEPAFPSGNDPAGHLSKMELKILTHIGKGHTSKQIAEDLDLAVGTVNNYVSAVMHKTGLTSRSRLASYACYYGLVHFNTEPVRIQSTTQRQNSGSSSVERKIIIPI